MPLSAILAATTLVSVDRERLRLRYGKTAENLDWREQVVSMNDQYSSSDEGAEQTRQPDLEADIEAARKAQSAALAATEELRNVLQTKGEQGKFGPGYATGKDERPE